MNTLPEDEYHSQAVILKVGQKLVAADDTLERKPRFVMFGDAALPLLQQMNMPTSWLFWELAQRRNWNSNIAVLEKAELSDAQYARVRVGLIELERMGIAKRIKQNTYMFNPDMVIPVRGYLQVRKAYENC